MREKVTRYSGLSFVFVMSFSFLLNRSDHPTDAAETTARQSRRVTDNTGACARAGEWSGQDIDAAVPSVTRIKNGWVERSGQSGNRDNMNAPLCGPIDRQERTGGVSTWPPGQRRD